MIPCEEWLAKGSAKRILPDLSGEVIGRDKENAVGVRVGACQLGIVDGFGIVEEGGVVLHVEWMALLARS